MLDHHTDFCRRHPGLVRPPPGIHATGISGTGQSACVVSGNPDAYISFYFKSRLPHAIQHDGSSHRAVIGDPGLFQRLADRAVSPLAQMTRRRLHPVRRPREPRLHRASCGALPDGGTRLGQSRHPGGLSHDSVKCAPGQGAAGQLGGGRPTRKKDARHAEQSRLFVWARYTAGSPVER